MLRESFGKPKESSPGVASTFRKDYARYVVRTRWSGGSVVARPGAPPSQSISNARAVHIT